MADRKDYFGWEDDDLVMVSKRKVTKDAEPRTLYVRRNVLNAAEIIKWAKSVGFETTLPADDMHVTIAFSRQPVDWMQVPDNQWAAREDGTMQINPGGPRIIEVFGEARVLSFVSSELSYRHESIKIATGATWDHPQYQPHITLSYGPVPVGLSLLEGYRGAIILGPEIFEEVNERWREGVVEDAAPSRSGRFGWDDDDLGEVGTATRDFNPHHEPAGKSTGGQFTSAPAGGGQSASAPAVPSTDKQDRLCTDSLKEDLTEDELRLVFNYVHADFEPINNHLRGRPTPPTHVRLSKKELAAYYAHAEEGGKKMNALFNSKVALAEELTTYRGLSKNATERLKSVKDGQVFEDKAFVSTSLSKAVADKFAKEKNGTTVRVALSKGSKALPLGSLGFRKGEEHEVLVQANSKFVKRSDKNGVYLELRN